MSHPVDSLAIFNDNLSAKSLYLITNKRKIGAEMVFKVLPYAVVPRGRYVETVVQYATVIAGECAVIERNLRTNHRVFSQSMEVIDINIQSVFQRFEVKTEVKFLNALPLKITEIAVILVARTDVIAKYARRIVAR